MGAESSEGPAAGQPRAAHEVVRELQSEVKLGSLAIYPKLSDPPVVLARLLVHKANHGGGLLIIGADFPNGSVGFDSADSFDAAARTVRDAILLVPNLRADVARRRFDGRDVLAVTVQPGGLLIAPSGAYLRENESGEASPATASDFRRELTQGPGAPLDSYEVLADMNGRLSSMDDELVEARKEARSGFAAAAHARRPAARASDLLLGAILGVVLSQLADELITHL